MEPPGAGDWLGMRDRTVLVAGAGGLGGASALALAGLGAHVLAVDVDQARLTWSASFRRAVSGPRPRSPMPWRSSPPIAPPSSPATSFTWTAAAASSNRPGLIAADAPSAADSRLR